MASDFSPADSLLQALETLSKDERLARFFSNDGSSACSLHLWLLELTQTQTPKYRLLFGQVIPATFQSLDKWNILDGGKGKNLGTQENFYKFRIAKLTLYHNSNAIFNLIKGLCQGLCLDKSCDRAYIVRPVHLKNPYGQLRLAGSPGQLTKSFAVRPVVFLETRATNRAIIEELKPIASPIDNVPAFAGSLWRLDKLSLFSRNGREPLAQADDLVKICLSHLTEETGLNFRGADSERLGNIEWLCFPAADEKENSQVKVSTDSSTCSVEVKILPNSLESGTQVLVRCQLRNHREVILDQFKTAQITETTIQVDFQTNQEISKILVSIWIRQNHEDPWEIWYEHQPFVLRQINVNLGGVSLQGTLKSDWLEEFSKSKVRERVEKAQAVRQVHYERLEIGGYESSPWIPGSQQIRRLTQRLFPEVSGGRFFPKGWDANAEEPGRLSFFEWLKSLTNNSTASKILIVDPYFDTSGIIELVARAQAIQAEYVVLTNTQVKSDDDSLRIESDKAQEVNELKEPSRATHLKEACKQVELLLTNLKFRLLDLRSREGGRTQLFHDRYILVFDEFGEVQTGYHLSNSIQGATKKHPLLITPIPKDVLTDVKDYVAGLLVPPANSQAELISLFSSATRTETPIAGRYLSGLAAVPHAGFFFAALLSDNGLSSLSEVELGDCLQNYGLFDREGNVFEVTDKACDQLDFWLDNFTQALITSSAADFTKLWAGLGEWLDHTPNGEQYLDTVIASGGEKLVVKLQAFLSQAPNMELPIDSLEVSTNAEALKIIDLIQWDFRKVISQATELLKHADYKLWSYYLQGYGIQYAAQVLAQLAPERLVIVISEICQERGAKLGINTVTSKLWFLAHTLALIIKQILDQLILIQLRSVTDSALLLALLRSDLPLLRAVGAYSVSPLWNPQTDLQNSFAAVSRLQEIERVHALAEWVFELRVRANVKNHEDTEIKYFRLAIFDRIRQAWPPKITQEELRALVRRLSGPAEGGWAVSTTNELLLHLVQQNKLTVNDITQLWMTILFKRLEAHVFAANNKQGGKSFHSYTYNPRDKELTQVCGWALAYGTVECREDWFKKLEKKIQKPGERVLYHPFSRSRDFSTWCGARDGLLWLQILFNFTRHYRDNGMISNSDKVKIEELIRNLDRVLTNTLDQENFLESTKGLLELSSGVKQEVKERLNDEN